MKKHMLVTTICCALLACIYQATAQAQQGEAMSSSAMLDTSPNQPPVDAKNVRALITQQFESIRMLEVSVADLEAKARIGRNKVARMQAQLDTENRVLRTIREFLDEGQTVYAVGDRRYTREDVTRDVAARLEWCRELQENMGSEETVVIQLGNAVIQARNMLDEAKKQLKAMTHRVRRLDIRDQTGGIMASVSDQVAQVGDDSALVAGQLQETLRAYEQAIIKREILAEHKQLDVAGGGVIDYGRQMTGSDPRDEIDRYLENAAGKKQQEAWSGMSMQAQRHTATAVAK